MVYPDEITDFEHRADQLDAGDGRSLVVFDGQPNVRSMDFCSIGGSGKVEFDAIELFKTEPEQYRLYRADGGHHRAGQQRAVHRAGQCGDYRDGVGQ